MKFSALNTYFSCPSRDSLGSRRLAQAGVKDGYPLKNGYFTAIGSFCMKTVGETRTYFLCLDLYQALVTSLLMVSTLMTSNDLELPKWEVLVFFLQFLTLAHISRVNCADMAGKTWTTCKQELLKLSSFSWALLKLLVYQQSDITDDVWQ